MSVKKLPLFLWFLFLLTPTGCSMGEHVDLSGRLIYSGGGKDIEIINLDSMESGTIYEDIHNGTTITRLTKVTPDKFIFEECPVTEACVLKEFDISSRTSKTLCTGRMPTYVPESKTLFFYDYSKDNKEKWLFVSDLGAMDDARKVAKAPADKVLPNGLRYPLMTPVIQISADEVALVGEDEQLWIYQISESNLKPTGIKHSFPEIWRSQTQQLIYYDWESKEYHQIDWKTKRSEKLPQIDDAFGLTYIPKHDALVFGEGSLHFLISERYDIYAYSFENKKKVKLRSHASIWSGFWLE